MNEEQIIFLNILNNNSFGCFCAPTNAQLGINVLANYLLGEDFYVSSPLNNEQINTEIIDTILTKYSKQYIKDKKVFKKIKK